ncbi:MAG: hypothetical protein HOP35_06220 [Nitrospira sp.]|nr:hypothetical protein [Nitrospira sp.]
MSLILDSTQQAFVQAMQTGDARQKALHIVVVRLLAVALMVTDWRQPHGSTAPQAAPNHYRAWPMVESEMESRGLRQRLRFYVCPQAAILSDDQLFPIGTVFIVETSRMEGPDKSLVTRFVMEKYAGVTTGESDPVPYGAWVATTYGPGGEVLQIDAASCGICRLPLE